MGNLVFNTFKLRMLSGATGEIDLVADTIKMMLAKTDDEPDDPDIEFVADYLGAGDAEELDSTGYAGGFGNAGRLTLGSKAIAVDQANNRAEWDFANPTWSTITQAGAETVVAGAAIKEITNDAASPLLAKFDTATGLPLTPNGSDITLTVDAEGFLHFT